MLCQLSAPTAFAQVDELLKPYESGDREFERLEIGNLIVFWHQRMIGDAIVEKDQIVYQFDKDTEELLVKKMQWRDDLTNVEPARISEEDAEAIAGGEPLFSNLYIISPESDVFKLDPVPMNPCWVVRTIIDDITRAVIIDAVTGEFLGYGVPPPHESYSFSGPIYDNPCSDSWYSWYLSARTWFNQMGYDCISEEWPTRARIQNLIQNDHVGMFYEIAHGSSSYFSSGCIGGSSFESTYSSDIASWITGYSEMRFTFLASCDGMCNTGSGSFSYAFRKGLNSNTTTVGYCGMSQSYCADCWTYSVSWQNALFDYMDLGWTVKDAFDQAMADYPTCAGSNNCMRFAGDTTFAGPYNRISGPVASGTVIGTVTDSSGSVSDVYVLAEDQFLHTGSDTTAGDGTYSITVPVGVFDLSFSHPDYSDTVITGVSVTEDDTTIVDLFMYPAIGACCVDEVCTATNTEQECYALGGLWFNEEACPDAGGNFDCSLIFACCVDDVCVTTFTASECYYLNGDWYQGQGCPDVGGNFECPLVLDFEAGNGGLAGDGDWEWGTPTNVGPSSANSGVNCWGTDLDDYRTPGSGTWICSNLFFQLDLGTDSNAVIAFWHWYEASGSTYDSLTVKIDTGSGWLTLRDWNGGPSPYWEQVVVDLSDYTGIVDINFQYASRSSVTSKAGWYIDDLALSGCVIIAPDIDVTPMTISGYADPGSSDADTLTISNTGDGTLNYSVSTYQNPSVTRFDGTVEQLYATGGFRVECELAGYYPVEEKLKGENFAENEQGEPFFLPEPLSSGGPDAFGYRWIDSDEPGGPTFAWVDISTVGTLISLGDDDNQGPFTLGFNVDYYGNSYSGIRVCSNGWASFTSTSTSLSNTNMPSAGEPENTLAVFWDDLNPSAGGSVYYYADSSNNRFIISYDGVPHYSGTGSSLYFQIIVNADGSIIYQYNTMNHAGHAAAATIGIENADGTIGLEYDYNSNPPAIHDSLAILFSMPPDWLTTDVSSGSIPSGGSADPVEVTMDALELTMGIYTGGILITSNDPDQTVIDIPVTFVVGTPGTIAGTVTDSSGPVSGVQVFADDGSGNTGSDTTAGDGTYSVVVTAGVYDVLFSHLSYIDTTISDVTVTLNDTTIVDVLLIALPTGDVGPIAILSETAIVVDSPYTPIFAVANFGSTTPSFDVRFTIELDGSPVYVDTTPVSNIPAFDTVDVVFSEFTPTSSGTYNSMITTEYSSDENRSNDTLSVNICAYDEIYNFEADGGGLTAANDWEWGTPTNVGPPSAHSGVNCWGTDLDDYRTPGSGTWIYSNLTFQLDLGTDSNAVMEFWHWYEASGAALDSLTVKVDTGAGWMTLQDWNGGPTSSWGKVIVDLSTYTGFVNINFQYASRSSFINKAGWYIDDLVLSGCAIVTPDIDVTPLTISGVAEPGSSDIDTLIVSNTGDGMLNYSVFTYQNPFVTRFNGTGEPLTESGDSRVHHHSADYRTIGDKSGGDVSTESERGEQYFPPELLSIGGPDAFGYTWIDSDEPGGPSYNWIDISSVGTLIPLGGDDNQGPFALGFTVNYYGNLYNEIRVCSNGWASFTSTSTSNINYCTPWFQEPNNTLAAFLDDLAPDSGGNVYYYADSLNNRFIISYDGVPYFPNDGTLYFQIIVNTDGRILFQYKNMDHGGQTVCAATGIENADGTIGLGCCCCCQPPPIFDSLAILFNPPGYWLTTNTYSGSVPPGGSPDLVEITMDAFELTMGIYTGEVQITSNDPDETVIDIPVTFVVGAPGTIAGTVTDSSGPVSGVYVSADDGLGHTGYDTTAGEGTYSMTVMAGVYDVLFSHPAYRDTVISNVTVTLNDTTIVDVAMEEIVVPIPTLSEWGMLILGLLLLAAGTVAIIRRKKAVSRVIPKY